MLKKFVSNYGIIFFNLIYSFAWSIKVSGIRDGGSDFYGYFFGARLLNNQNYFLYQEHFDHKGPFFYFFLKILTELFDKMQLSIFWSQYLVIVTIIFLYLTSLKKITDILIKMPFDRIIFCLLAASSLYLIDLIAINAIFVATLITFGYVFFFLTKNQILSKNHFSFHKYLLLANVFFFLAFLVRVDAIIHLVLFNILILISLKNKIYFYLISFITFFIVFLSLSIFFHFSFYEFYNSNIIFNFFYQSRQELVYFFYRPNLLNAFWMTGYFFFFLFILFHLNFSELKKNLISKYISIQLILSFLLLYFTKYDKNYFILILLPSTFVFCCFFFKAITIKKKFFLKYFLLLYLILINVWSLEFMYKIIKSNMYEFFFVKKGHELAYTHNIVEGMQKTYLFIKENNLNDIYIVCSEAQDNYFYNIKNPKVTLNAWLYTPPGFLHKNFIDHYNELINKPSGFIFFVQRNCTLAGRPETDYLKRVIESSSLVSDDGYLQVRMLK